MIQEIVNGYSMLQIVLIAEYVLDAVSCREVVKHYWFVQYFYVTKEIKSKWTSNPISIGCSFGLETCVKIGQNYNLFM